MEVQISKKLQFFITEQKRYKGAYGGRGAGKSWAITDSILVKIIENPRKPLRILCTRELQNTIKDSVHRLIADRISYHKLDDIFEIRDSEIRAKNGSLFIFKGLRTNITEIKSLEGIDICWVEEAEKVSKESWEVLIPTIRKEDSEIWFSWNTGTKNDPVWRLFVENPPPDSIVVKVNYYDNPWFPNVLKKEMEHDKATNEKKYNRIWLGEPAEGGIFFSNFDADMMEEQPFSIPPHNLVRRLYGGFDFGWGVTGYASFNLVCLDGNGVPHFLLHWYQPNMTAQEQADDLYETIEGFHQTSGVFPYKIAYDYEMDIKGKNEANEWAPIDYFKERWRAGGKNPESWVRANKKRIMGWQCVIDYLGKDVVTKLPKMKYWPQFNVNWVAAMEQGEADENNPLDLMKSDNDHPCDSTRYVLMLIRGILVEKDVAKVSKNTYTNIQRDIKRAEAIMGNPQTGY